jgi:rhomboid family protein
VRVVGNTSIGARLHAWLTAVWRFVSSAPLTYVWLVVLLITTIIQHQLSRRELHTVLVHGSTNIRHLATDPLEVLFSSLLWIDGRYWTPYLVLFTLFLAPAEQWLNQMRWLTVGLTAHIGATYFSEGLLYLAIQQHLEPERLVHARDIGVSYFLVGVIAVLAYRIAPPWRWGYLAILIGIFTVAMIIHLNFTAIGHFSAIFIGLCFYPMARARNGPLVNPANLFRRTGGGGRVVSRSG